LANLVAVQPAEIGPAPVDLARRAGLAVVFDAGSVTAELGVVVDADGLMALNMSTPNLRVEGSRRAKLQHCRDGSIFAWADVAVLGYCATVQRCVNGRISVGITWTTELNRRVAGTAVAEGPWSESPLLFDSVTSHSFNRGIVRLLSSWPRPS